MCEIVRISGCQPKSAKPCSFGYKLARTLPCDNNNVKYVCSKKTTIGAGGRINTAICNNSLKKYCPSLTGVSEFDYKRCSKWCLENPGKCDSAVTGFCVEHPLNPYCSCINSELNKKPFAENTTVCFDNMCRKPSSYKTAANVVAMKGTCPNMARCGKKIDKQDLNEAKVDISKFKDCLTGNGLPQTNIDDLYPPSPVPTMPPPISTDINADDLTLPPPPQTNMGTEPSTESLLKTKPDLPPEANLEPPPETNVDLPPETNVDLPPETNANLEPPPEADLNAGQPLPPQLQKKAKPNNFMMLFALFFIFIVFLAIIGVFVLRGRRNYKKNINL